MSDSASRRAPPASPFKMRYAVELEAGKACFWCACGQSTTQPCCDGSHRGAHFSPLKFSAETDGRVFFCGCKATGKAPLCDGSHKAA